MMYTNEFNEIMKEFFGGSPNSYYKKSVVTKSNEDENNYEVNQTKDGAYLFFEAPGFNKENLKVEIEDGVMTIDGKRNYKMNGEEISKSVHKQFKLGNEYNPELIEATIEDGLLTVFIPGFKKQEKKKISLL